MTRNLFAVNRTRHEPDRHHRKAEQNQLDADVIEQLKGGEPMNTGLPGSSRFSFVCSRRSCTKYTASHQPCDGERSLAQDRGRDMCTGSHGERRRTGTCSLVALHTAIPDDGGDHDGGERRGLRNVLARDAQGDHPSGETEQR